MILSESCLEATFIENHAFAYAYESCLEAAFSSSPKATFTP